MITKTELKRWTIYNKEDNTLLQLTDQGFSNGVKTNNIILKSGFIEIEIKHPEPSRIKQTQKIWVDGIINNMTKKEG